LQIDTDIIETLLGHSTLPEEGLKRIKDSLSEDGFASLDEYIDALQNEAR
jgi:hypothetical protein|tara:strand:- start:1711 stop:1860 length:150 start_codon:yes stop_codon:yes gene_type:complete